MKKQWWFLAMLAAVLVCLAGCGGEKVEGLEYLEMLDGTVSITRYTGDAEHLEIPAKIDGKKITGIASQAFFKNETLVSVVIPTGVTLIGQSAFAACPLLETVTISGKVTTIYGMAFAECPSLTSINLPRSVVSIQDRVFFNSDNVVVEVEDNTNAHTYCQRNKINFKVK